MFMFEKVFKLLFLNFCLQGTIRILSQIGQDTAITEQQIKVVKAQLDKISKLKKVPIINTFPHTTKLATED